MTVHSRAEKERALYEAVRGFRRAARMLGNPVPRLMAALAAVQDLPLVHTTLPPLLSSAPLSMLPADSPPAEGTTEQGPLERESLAAKFPSSNTMRAASSAQGIPFAEPSRSAEPAMPLPVFPLNRSARDRGRQTHSREHPDREAAALQVNEVLSPLASLRISPFLVTDWQRDRTAPAPVVEVDGEQPSALASIEVIADALMHQADRLLELETLAPASSSEISVEAVGLAETGRAMHATPSMSRTLAQVDELAESILATERPSSRRVAFSPVDGADGKSPAQLRRPAMPELLPVETNPFHADSSSSDEVSKAEEFSPLMSNSRLVVDSNMLADLVNEALAAQARRHGVNLS